MNYVLMSLILSGCGDSSDKETASSSETDEELGLDEEVDGDGDGFSIASGDCNDEDASVYPGAEEIYNDGIDQNCDEEDDECESPCYNECQDPEDIAETFIITEEIFNIFLNEAGLLTEESCAFLCQEAVWEMYYTNVLEVYECREEGTDSENNHLLFCSAQVAPYCEGRLHKGATCIPSVASSSKGAWLARAAQAEALSVQSFLMLKKQLSFFGAPSELQEACLRAAREEVEHSREMFRYAQKEGAVRSKLSFGTYQDLSLLELAVDNVVEGCIREGFAALQALHQAEFAQDDEFRELMARIAFDECGHTELAWAIHAWLYEQLSTEERLEVEEAKARALTLIEAELQVKVTSPSELQLGLPSEEKSKLLFYEFERQCA